MEQTDCVLHHLLLKKKINEREKIRKKNEKKSVLLIAYMELTDCVLHHLHEPSPGENKEERGENRGKIEKKNYY